jgi:hypothetical protein
MKNNLYYDADSTRDMIPLSRTSRFTLDSTSFRDGFSTSFNIPNDMQQGHLVFELEFDPNLLLLTSGGGAKITAPLGWGYQLIANVQYSIAGSSVIQVPGVQLLMSVLQDCDNQTKAQGILELGGPLISNNTDHPNLPSACAFSRATMLIPTPWSVLTNNGVKCLPADLVSSPVRIYITMNPIGTVFGGADFAAKFANFTYSVARLQCVQYRLNNSLDSLRPVLMQNPELFYMYPMVFKQGITYNVKGSTDTYNGQFVNKVTLNLVGFRQAQCLSVVVGVVENNYINAGVADQSHCLIKFQELLNVDLSFNGISYYYALGNSNQLMTACNSENPGYIPSTISENTYDGTGSTGAKGGGSKIYPVEMPFTQHFSRYMTTQQHAETGMRIDSNTLQLSFLTPTFAPLPTPLPTVNVAKDYTVYVLYNYNGAIKFQAGSAQIVL